MERGFTVTQINHGRHHSLAQCSGVQNLIAQHKSRQLAARGGISKPFFHRCNSWWTKKPAQFGARVRPSFADRGGRSGGGNGAAGGNSGGSGGHGGNGHHGRRGSPSGHSFRDGSSRPFKRVGFSSRPTPCLHTNNVSVPEQGDDDAVRQIVQANSASPHLVGAGITADEGKELMESPPTVSRKQLAAESDSDLIITFTRERVLFIGTQFSILYTSMYSPAEAATLSSEEEEKEEAELFGPHGFCACISHW